MIMYLFILHKKTKQSKTKQNKKPVLENDQVRFWSVTHGGLKISQAIFVWLSVFSH